LLCLIRKHNMQSTLIFGLIALGVVSKMAVLWRCVTVRLVRRHVLFCTMVALSMVRSALALNGQLHPYAEFWTASQWPMAILEAGAAVEAFWLVAAHFRKIRRFGMVLLGFIVCLAATVAYGVGLVRAHWNGPLRGAVLFGQYTHLGLLVVTLLSVIFFWQFRDVPVRPNASRHLLVLAALFGSYFIGNFLAQASHGQWRFLSNLVIASGTIVAYGWWALRTTAAGEVLPFAQAPPLSKSEYAAAKADDERTVHEINRVSVKALRRMLRR